MKKARVFIYTAVLLVLGVSIACAWGAATHTYFADRLGAKFGLSDLNEMYGAVLPDLPTTMFDARGDFLYLQTHDHFDLFLNGASGCDLKSVAFGFVCHNDVWGADFIAHHSGFNTPGTGYVVAKGNMLTDSLTAKLITILTPYVGHDNAAFIASQLAPTLGEDLVETAIDVLVKRTEDREIGQKMFLAAKYRSDNAPTQLASAYAHNLATFAGITDEAAAAFLIGAEGAYREQMMGYGDIFSLNETQIVGALAEQSAGLASLILKSQIGVDVTVAPALVEQFIREAMEIAEPDYRFELRRTLAYLEGQMHKRHIPVCHGRFAKGEGGELPEAMINETPVEFTLGDNYPNPFNPSTTIEYSVPNDSRVSLKVYNSLGQEVATLVDGEMVAGHYQVAWNASNVASGLYFYRLIAGTNSAVKRMLVLK